MGQFLTSEAVQTVIAQRLLGLAESAWSSLQSRLVLRITLQSDTPAYDWMVEWLAGHPDALTIRNLQVVVRRHDEADQAQVILAPGPGEHLLREDGSLIWVSIRQPTQEQPGRVYRVRSAHEMTLTFLRKNRQQVLKLLEEARLSYERRRHNLLRVMRYGFDTWQEGAFLPVRRLESVVLAEGVLERLVADILSFMDREEWYADLGIPFRRGYLLVGPPGNGKSSLVMALAGHLQAPLCPLTLANESVTDSTLADMMSNLPPRAIVLIEDIDALFDGRTALQSGKLTFSGLLNAIDGVSAGSSRLLFVTTNHPERLDPALIRPGRIDQILELGNADRDQARRMFLRFFPGADAHAAQFAVWAEGQSMATLQQHLIARHHDINEAVHAP